MNWKPARLTKAEFVAGLIVKISLGLLYGYIYLHYYGGDDTWRFHQNSIAETKLLINNTTAFFINDLTPVHALTEGKNWTDVIRLYLVDLQYAFLVKPLAVFNLISQGNYYINAAMFNGVVYFGHYWLFKALVSLFPEKRLFLYLSVFLFLPATFWLSGIRIDGLLFLFLALYIYQLNSPTSFRRAVFLIFSFVGILVCRTETALLVVPATAAFLLSRACNPWKSFALVYTAAILLLFTSEQIPGVKGLPSIIADKQHAFLALEGTRFELDTLNVSPVSFIRIFPQALSNTYIRPFIWETDGLLQLIAAAEIILFWILVATVFIFREEDWRSRVSQPLVLFLGFVSISMYVSIGYLVPFPGAIIRYKAIALLLNTVILAILLKPRTNKNIS